VSVHNIHLRKLLQLFHAAPSLRTSKLREDIRNTIAAEEGRQSQGPDFHSPFWADAKSHVAGMSDLHEQTGSRIAANARRRHLYPLLRDGFLAWWNVRRRWRNEPFELITESVHGRLEIPELGATVKIENTLAFRVDHRATRIIYPYFCEDPTLTEAAARQGLWAMNEAELGYSSHDLRILDVLRSTSFGVEDAPFRPVERRNFLEMYRALIADWERLRAEYL